MPLPRLTSRALLAAAGVAIIFGGIFFYELRPAGVSAAQVQFQINPGDGFSKIATGLRANGLIRSETAFKFYALATGAANKLKPGIYPLDASMSSQEILHDLVTGANREVDIRILNGSAIVDIDKILSDAGVLPQGALVAYAKTSTTTLEGKLFPDTYRFFINSQPEEVVQKFLSDFNAKAAPLLAADPAHAGENLILASIVEKEAATEDDQKIVAGILKKRLKAGMPLEVDATICYIKKENQGFGGVNCYPLTALDFKIDSPYNTYLYKGLPPAPIGSPSAQAIAAVLNAKSSPYWFYLSDPATHKIIFSRTLEEQEANRSKYLK